MRLHITLTVLISAFFLLLVQPMLSKMLLPHIGGAPSVWIASMLFFQTMLLAGYGYAALTTRFLSTYRQWLTHIALFVIAILTAIPLVLHLPDFAANRSPVGWVLVSLLFTIGAPYFILSASSSLLQRWYHSATGKEPYFLFSASNAGSFLGLFGYPFLIEWLLGLEEQLLWFSYGFIFLFLCFLGLYSRLKSVRETQTDTKKLINLPAKNILHTLFLAFIPSALFLALTLFITTDVGSFPMVWIIPLALYLLSFVVAFASWGNWLINFSQKTHLVWLAIALISSFITLAPSLIFLHFLAFFFIAVSCHGQLARIRPEPEKLTAFFFWVSAGGALGGLLNTAMPYLIDYTLEYPILIAISLLALPAKRALHELKNLSNPEKLRISAGMTILCFSLSYAWFGPSQELPNALKLLHQSRNFYGVSKVEAIPTEKGELVHRYSHGTTTHGIQSRRAGALDATSYYLPIAELVQKLPSNFHHQPFANVGLGAGTTACNGKKGQKVDFFEIDLAVIEIAQNPDYFTYLSDCPADIRIIEGDGRLKLAEQPDDIGYNLLVMDAFTSDAIPMHLLTKEAVEMYIQKMSSKTGIIAFNVSNRYYKLAPFLSRVANEFGWQSHAKTFKYEKNPLTFPSSWLLMIPPGSPWVEQIEAMEFEPVLSSQETPLWTDDYSNLLRALHIRKE